MCYSLIIMAFIHCIKMHLNYSLKYHKMSNSPLRMFTLSNVGWTDKHMNFFDLNKIPSYEDNDVRILLDMCNSERTISGGVFNPKSVWQNYFCTFFDSPTVKKIPIIKNYYSQCVVCSPTTVSLECNSSSTPSTVSV